MEAVKSKNLQEIFIGLNAKMEAYLFASGTPSHAHEDIIQDVFLKVISHEERILAMDNPQGYIMQAVKNRVKDEFRKKDVIKEDFLSLNDSELNETEGHILTSCLPKSISKLPHKYKDPLMLLMKGKMSQKEIARYLDLPYSTTKSLIQRGKEKIKSQIQECCNLDMKMDGSLVLPQESVCENC